MGLVKLYHHCCTRGSWIILDPQGEDFSGGYIGVYKLVFSLIWRILGSNFPETTHTSPENKKKLGYGCGLWTYGY